MFLPAFPPYPVYNTRYASPYAHGNTPAAQILALRWGKSRGFFGLAVQILSLAPNSGPAAGGTTVVIRGQGFQPGAQVTFGGTAATGEVVYSSTLMTAVTPAHAAGAVDVVVTNPNGQTATRVGGFTYV